MKHDYLTIIEISECEDVIKTNEQLEIESLKEQLAELRSIVSGVNEGLSKGLSKLDRRVSEIDALLLVRGANLGDILSKIDHRFSNLDRRVSNLTRRAYGNETSTASRFSKIEASIQPKVGD